MNPPAKVDNSQQSSRSTWGAGFILLVAGVMYAMSIALSIPKEIYAEHPDALRLPFLMVCFAGVYAVSEMWRMNRRLKKLEERLSSMTDPLLQTHESSGHRPSPPASSQHA
jgi:hypothetical protein